MFRYVFPIAMLSFAALAQEPTPAQPPVADASVFTVPAGTKIPLSLIKGVNSKSAMVGDRIYLETAFPILSGNRIVIPPGSWVAGTVTEVKRPGKVKGRGEIYLRFDSLTLQNGVTRDFRSRMGGLDGQNPGTLDRDEGKVTSDGGKASDAMKVGQGAGWGAMVGGIANGGKGAGIGAGAGAAAGVAAVLLSRGPEAMIERGSIVELVLDRDLAFAAQELEGTGTSNRRTAITPAGQAAGQRQTLPGWPRQD